MLLEQRPMELGVQFRWVKRETVAKHLKLKTHVYEPVTGKFFKLYVRTTIHILYKKILHTWFSPMQEVL